MMTKRSFVGLLVASLVTGTLQALPPPPPGHGHNHHPPRGMAWCPKCDGDGYNRAWYGARKKCHICNGTGFVPHVEPHHPHGAQPGGWTAGHPNPPHPGPHTLPPPSKGPSGAKPGGFSAGKPLPPPGGKPPKGPKPF